MLDALAALARRPKVLAAAAVLVLVAVLGPALLGGGDEDTPATTTSTAAEATTTTVELPTTSGGAVAEVDHAGEPADPSLYAGQRVAGAAPDDERRQYDHDRAVGGTEPARISGFSAWADAVDAPETDPQGAPGPWLRVRVRVLNRDEGPQPYVYSDWTLAGPDGVVLQALRASPDFSDGAQLPANSQVEGELWFAPRQEGTFWLLYRPQNDRQRGVWAVEVPPG